MLGTLWNTMGPFLLLMKSLVVDWVTREQGEGPRCARDYALQHGEFRDGSMWQCHPE